MDIDWGQAKKKTLWHYDELIQKLLGVLSYAFVQECYNHSMPEAAAYSSKIRHGYRQNEKDPAFIAEVTEHFKTLQQLGVRDYLDLVQRVETKAKCEDFLQQADLRFDALLEILNYLFRWVLPFRCPVAELGATIPHAAPGYLALLRDHRIRSNLDVLETCRTRTDRAILARETGLPELFILELTHRADMSRLAYVRGQTIKHLCGGGYNTLEKVAAAYLETMTADMTAYYATLGKTFSDFKAVIPLDWMIGGARILPRLVEV